MSQRQDAVGGEQGLVLSRLAVEVVPGATGGRNVSVFHRGKPLASTTRRNLILPNCDAG